MRRAAGALVGLAGLLATAVLVAACPGRTGGPGSAEPADVQVNWPDAAPHAPRSPDAG